MSFQGTPAYDTVSSVVTVLEDQQWTVHEELRIDGDDGDLQLNGAGLSLVLNQ